MTTDYRNYQQAPITGVPSEYLALSALDGRYAKKVMKKMAPYTSEFALQRERVHIEVEWFIRYIAERGEVGISLSEEKRSALRDLYVNFDGNSMQRIKEIEETTNHDVKSVEYYLAEHLEPLGLSQYRSFLHISCTSEDITNLSYAVALRGAIENVWMPSAITLLKKLAELALKYKDQPMLAFTHGQPATPTTVGKEFAVYLFRLARACQKVADVEPLGKFNGATGNYAALSLLFPGGICEDIAERLVVENLDLELNPITTQIESHDWVAEMLDAIRRFNNILYDLDQDCWMYIHEEYFKLIPKKGEVGSSTMPNKVNPINFENSKGNILIARGLSTSLADGLTISKWQRELTDSTMFRNIGLPIGHSFQAINETTRGLNKIAVNEQKLEDDLDAHWEVLAEAIQTMMRKYMVPDAYEQLKELTRGKAVTREGLHALIEKQDYLSETDRNLLLNMEPRDYIGIAPRIAEDVVDLIEAEIDAMTGN